MNQSLCILGRQPALGLAELDSLFGASSVAPIAPEGALIDMDAKEVPLSHLGGTIKVCKLLTFLPYTDWSEITVYLLDNISQHLEYISQGKIKLGLSCYGIKTSPKSINATGLELKRIVRSAGRSIRVIPNKSLALNSAQVLHNQLTGPTGVELAVMRDGNRTILAQTVNIQDIDAYAARDQARPKRDARVGMLPPKLAQIILNLATGQIDLSKEQPIRQAQGKRAKSKDEAPTAHSSLLTARGGFTILDPFCGTGVLLQEALLMGFDAYGTDMDQRMIEYSLANLDWLATQFALSASFKAEAGDATNHTWKEPFSIIASETYLGRPFSTRPTPELLNTVIRDVNTIHKKFLFNVAKQVPSGFRLALAVPAWKVHMGFRRLPILDHLNEIGYTRVSFVHAGHDELIYHRPEQIVARELAVLIRN